MQEVRDAEQSVLPLQSEPQGRLRISVPESLAISLLPDLLLRFHEKYPGLELDVQVTGRFIDLVEEGIDLTLRVGKLEDSSLIARLIMPCGFHVCGSPEYFKNHGIPLHPAELEAHNCLIYSQVQKPDHWSFKDAKGKAFSLKVKGNLISEAGNLLMNAALNGYGVFIGPSYMVKDAIKNGRLKTVLDEYTHPATGLYTVYPYS